MWLLLLVNIYKVCLYGQHFFPVTSQTPVSTGKNFKSCAKEVYKGASCDATELQSNPLRDRGFAFKNYSQIIINANTMLSR